MDSGAMDGHPSFRFFLSEWRCEMDFSTHALQRCRQRGIRAIQIDWLIAYGAFTWNRGAKVFFFDRSGFQLLLQSLLPAEQVPYPKDLRSWHDRTFFVHFHVAHFD